MSMETTSMIDAEPVVYFVSTKRGEDSQEIFQQSLKACQEAGLNPIQLAGGECLNIKTLNKNEVFILDSFHCSVYDYLLDHNARILGASCVLHCLKNSEDLPERNHPVYSMCMREAQVTLTGVPTAQRAELVKKIEWLGGVCTKSLVKSTTHLIAQEVSSKKYQAATSLGIPIITQQWVSESFEMCKTRLFDAHESSFLQKFKCPMFIGCVVTTSNISDKENIREIVEKGGGTYTGQMAYKECTHLVINKPEGQKYKSAQKWGSVHIVKPLWLYDCQTTGYKLAEEESKYSVSKGASTPEKEHFPLPNISDVSAIHSSTFSVTHIDETMATVSRGRRSSGDTIHTTTEVSAATKRSSDLDSTRTMSEADSRTDVLVNCKVCLRGFDGKMTASLSAMISSCGGTRSQSTVVADYIVISTLDENTLEHVKALRQPVVSSEWLKQVYQTRNLVDVEPHLMYKPNKRKHTTSEGDTSLAKRRTTTVMSPQADQSMLDTEMLEGGNEELLSQYGAAEPDVKGKSKHTITPVSNPTSASADQSMTIDVVSRRGSDRDILAATPLLVTQHKQDLALNMPFKDIRFIVNELPDEERKLLTVMISTHGGVVIANTEQASMSMVYRVMPLIIHHRYEDSTDCTTVSSTWIRMCDRLCTLLPVDSNPLFTPTTCVDTTILDECVITTTGLSAPEREAISILVSSGGGRYFEDLRKFAGHGKPATTHLISQSVDSSKYRAAKNWGLSITKISWVTDSIKAGLSQPVEAYMPLKDDETSSHGVTSERRTISNLQTPIHSRVQALRLGSTGSSTKKKPLDRKQYLSTSIIDNPDKSFHMQLDLDCFATPEIKPHNPVCNENGTPLDKAMDKYLQIALDKHYIKTPDGNCQVKSTEVAAAGAPTTATDAILSGSVICLSKKLASLSDHVSTVVCSLGGQYRPSYDPAATHFLYQGKASDADYRAAKRNNQYIVCPMWLDKCKEENKRVSESLYPYNCKAHKTTIDTPNRRSSRVTRVSQSPMCSANPEPEAMETASSTADDITSPTEAAAEAAAKGEETQTGLTDTLLVLNQIKSYMNKRLTVPKKQRKYAVTPTSSVTLPPEQNINTTYHSTARDPYVDTQSQGGALVIWEDATSRFEQEILENADSSGLDSEVLAQLDEDFTQEQTEPEPLNSPNLSTDYTANMETSTMDDMPQTPTTTPPVYQFSGFSNEERDVLSEELKTLGAHTILTSNFDPSCTHIILSKPQRNEKFLCALVKGLWLLDKSYVRASVDSNSLLPEEGYEWGNAKAGHMHCSSTSVKSYATAAHRRRVQVQSGLGCTSFSQWNVLLALAKDKIESMKRILEMGGANILSCSRLPDAIKEATHAFIDLKKSGLNEAEIQTLLNSDVKCLKAEYIPSYLVQDDNFDESKFKFVLPLERSSTSASSDRTHTSSRLSRKTSRT